MIGRTNQTKHNTMSRSNASFTVVAADQFVDLRSYRSPSIIGQGALISSVVATPLVLTIDQIVSGKVIDLTPFAGAGNTVTLPASNLIANYLGNKIGATMIFTVVNNSAAGPGTLTAGAVAGGYTTTVPALAATNLLPALTIKQVAITLVSASSLIAGVL